MLEKLLTDSNEFWLDLTKRSKHFFRVSPWYHLMLVRLLFWSGFSIENCTIISALQSQTPIISRVKLGGKLTASIGFDVFLRQIFSKIIENSTRKVRNQQWKNRKKTFAGAFSFFQIRWNGLQTFKAGKSFLETLKLVPICSNF